MTKTRPDELTAGTDTNLAALQRLLKDWACCEAPRACRRACQQDELAAVLAMASHVVTRTIERRHIAATAYGQSDTPASPVQQAVWRYEQSLRQLEDTTP